MKIGEFLKLLEMNISVRSFLDERLMFLRFLLLEGGWKILYRFSEDWLIWMKLFKIIRCDIIFMIGVF